MINRPQGSRGFVVLGNSSHYDNVHVQIMEKLVPNFGLISCPAKAQVHILATKINYLIYDIIDLQLMF